MDLNCDDFSFECMVTKEVVNDSVNNKFQYVCIRRKSTKLNKRVLNNDLDFMGELFVLKSMILQSS